MLKKTFILTAVCTKLLLAGLMAVVVDKAPEADDQYMPFPSCFPDEECWGS